ncbi:MAG: hypothetical protein WD971_13825 [Pirellulales bacterium]
MRTEKRFLAFVCWLMLLALGARRADAFDFVWVNATSSGQWATRANWQPYPNPPHVPTAGDTATFIDLYFSPEVYVPEGTMLDRMVVDYDAVVDLNISGFMDVDRIPGETLLIDSTATLNLESGWLYTADARLLRHATFNITGLGTDWLPDNVLVAGDVTNSAGIGLALSALADVYGTLDVGDNDASGRVVVDGITANLFDPTSLWTVYNSADIGTANILGNDNFGQVTLQRGGRMHVFDNMAVHGSPTATTQSKITVQTGGNLDVDGALTIGDYGRLELVDAASQITTGSFSKTGTGGSFNWTGGTLELANSPLFLDSNTPHSVLGSSLTVGTGRRLVVTTSHADDNLNVGRTGTGSLTVQNGGAVESFHVLVGYGAGANGTVVVGGGSRLDVTEDLEIGYAETAVGRLDITSGGLAQANSIHLGTFDTANGTVVVDGAGSTLTSNRVLSVGGFLGDTGIGGEDGGTGLLVVQNGGSTSVATVMKVWNGGTVTVTGSGSELAANEIYLETGASFSDAGGTITRTNALTGFGDAPHFHGNLLLGHAGGSGWGQLEVLPGQSLSVDQNLVVGEDAPATLWAYGAGTVSSAQGFIGGEPGSDGSQVRISDRDRTWTVANSLHVGGDGVSAGGTARLTVANSAVVDAGNIKIWQPGILELDNASIIADSIVLDGSLVGNGQISVDGQLTNAGVVSPGLSPGLISIDGNYVQTATGTLAIDLGGVHEGQFDRLEIRHGGGTLAGGLLVSLYGGYLPPVGSSFQILSADENLFGGFNPALISYPTLPGRQWSLRQRGGTVTLQVLAALLLGDYNGNGIVDAADYTVWRNNLGANITLPNEDPTQTPGWVTVDDYAVWKSHFGESSLGSGAGEVAPDSTGVPEPATLWLALIALAGSVRAARNTF